MGYTFYAKTKQDIIDEIKSNPKIEKSYLSTINGSRLWCIGNGEWAKYIVVFLLDCQNGLWGYKAIEECVHPNYYDCPIDYLYDVPVTNTSWRKKVREYIISKQ